MAIAGKITVDLEARDAKWSDGLSKSEKELKQFVDKSQKSLSALTLQKGVGAFADVFSKGAQAASDFATSIRTGMSQAEAFGKLLDAIPIVGKFKQGVEAVWELVTATKAEIAHFEKLSESTTKVIDGYREMAQAARLKGLFGDNRAIVQADIDTDAKITALHDKSAALATKRREIEQHQGDIVGGGLFSKRNLTQAQEDELKELELGGKLITAQIARAERGRQREKELIQREAAEHQRQFMRAEEEQVASFGASAMEKALRRSGKPLESAMIAVTEDASARIRAELDKLTDYALAGLNNKDRIARVRSVYDTIHAIQKDAAETSQALAQEDARRKLEITNDHWRSIVKLNREARINDMEAAGKHREAELTRIRGEYFDQVAEAEKKYREEHKSAAQVDRNDPTFKAAEQAAAYRRDTAERLLRAREIADIEKRQGERSRRDNEEFLKTQQKLFEEAKPPLEKYEEVIRELKQAFDEGVIDKEKYNKLVNDETSKTAKELQGDSHALSSEPLVGRTFDFRLPGVGAFGQGSPLESMLDLAKKRAEREAQMPDHLEKIRQKIVDTPEETIDINGIGTA
jgi:hypothetical protein